MIAVRFVTREPCNILEYRKDEGSTILEKMLIEISRLDWRREPGHNKDSGTHDCKSRVVWAEAVCLLFLSLFLNSVLEETSHQIVAFPCPALTVPRPDTCLLVSYSSDIPPLHMVPGFLTLYVLVSWIQCCFSPSHSPAFLCFIIFILSETHWDIWK